jgi:hypothetical protein
VAPRGTPGFGFGRHWACVGKEGGPLCFPGNEGIDDGFACLQLRPTACDAGELFPIVPGDKLRLQSQRASLDAVYV